MTMTYSFDDLKKDVAEGRIDTVLACLVDMQGRLMPVIHDNEAVLRAAHKLAQAARLLDVPVVATEHHAKMLGTTVEPLREQVQSAFQKSQNMR